MVATASHLATILAATVEKDKTAFYICGGLLAAWAVILSAGIGLRRPEFPGTLGGERTVIAISAVLVVATMTAAVATAGPPASATAAAPPSSTSNVRAGAVLAPPSSVLAVSANPTGQLAFSTKKLSAKAGVVRINFTNVSPLMHNMTIAHGSQVLGATTTFQGGTKSVSLDLKPGVYVFYCSVPGHRQAGMEGTLTVS
jgi:uncharacterized cupredoxin-like copper-binding protein